MEIKEIMNLVTNNAFSIVMCGLLFWKINEQDKDHKEETEKLATALENNTLAIQHLVDTLKQ